MNRKNFVLSWGRKVFFGFSWPITCVLSLICLQSYLVPRDLISTIYFITTTIGLFGLANAILYFLFFCPVVYLFPTYYLARFWSLILILSLNLFVLVDSMLFSSFRFHLNELVIKIAMYDGIGSLSQSSTPVMATIILGLILVVSLWFRGDWIWRVMQKRFSNPVSNWYLVLIVICLVVSKFTYHKELSSVFIVNYQDFMPDNKDSDPTSASEIYYPRRDMKCVAKKNPNLFMITIEGLTAEELDGYLVPELAHLKQHGTSFTNHMSGLNTHEDGIFSIFYSLPPVYREEMNSKQPVLFDELKTRGYQLAVFSEAAISPNDTLTSGSFFEAWKVWSGQNVTEEKVKPLAVIMNFKRSHSLALIDSEIKEILKDLHKNKFLENSYLFLSGTSGNIKTKIPFVLITPSRTEGTNNKMTFNYDVIPTIMKELWACKNTPDQYSFGEQTMAENSSFQVFGTKDDLTILDLKDGSFIRTNIHGKILEGVENIKKDSQQILKAFRKISSFYRP